MCIVSFVSKKYQRVSQNLNEIVNELLKNQKLLKWLTYLVDQPLSLPDVPAGKVLGNQIVLTRMNETILPKAATKMFIVARGGKDHRKGVLTDTVFQVDILSPHNEAYIYSTRKDRYIEVASEVAKSLDGRNITGVGDVVVSSDFTTYKVNETYSGLRFHITVTNQRVGRDK